MILCESLSCINYLDDTTELFGSFVGTLVHLPIEFGVFRPAWKPSIKLWHPRPGWRGGSQPASQWYSLFVAWEQSKPSAGFRDSRCVKLSSTVIQSLLHHTPLSHTELTVGYRATHWPDCREPFWDSLSCSRPLWNMVRWSRGGRTHNPGIDEWITLSHSCPHVICISDVNICTSRLVTRMCIATWVWGRPPIHQEVKRSLNRCVVPCRTLCILAVHH